MNHHRGSAVAFETSKDGGERVGGRRQFVLNHEVEEIVEKVGTGGGGKDLEDHAVNDVRANNFLFAHQHKFSESVVDFVL